MKNPFRKILLTVVCLFVGLLGIAVAACGKTHEHAYETTVIAPTCAQEGYTLHKCECGDEYKDNFTPTVGHEAAEPVYDTRQEADVFTSLTIVEQTLCKHCGTQLGIKEYRVTVVEQTYSYDGQLHEPVLGGDKLPAYIKAKPVYDDLISAGDHTVAVGFYVQKVLTKTEVFDNTLLTQVHIVKDGKYHEVTFVSNDAEQGNVSVAVKHGESIRAEQLPAVPQKTGYQGKWQYSAAPVVADLSITFSYTPIEYTITYIMESNTENNARNPLTYTIESPNLPLYAPQNESGLTFQGWYKTDEYNPTERISSIPAGSTGDITVYAKFLKYRVEAADGFTFDYKNYDYPALTQTVSNKRTSIALSSTIIVSDGCRWTLSKDIEGLETIKTKNMSLAEGHNIAYITVWYNETEDLNTVYYLDIYRLGMRTYQFLVDGVTYQEERTVEEQTMITAPAGTPRKLGYTFRGWKAMEEGAEPPYFEQTFPYRLDVNTVFEASFKANTYAVTYDALGGTVSAYAPKSGTYDALFTLPLATRTGYTFLGWQDEKDNKYLYATSPQFLWQYTAPMQFTALYSAIEYSIEYNLNRGTNNSLNPETYTIESPEITLENATRTGYTFAGWYKNADFSGDPVEKISTGNYGNITLYAKWEVTDYSITYELNGGTNAEENPEHYTYETEDIILADPSDEHTFTGWYTDKKLTKKITKIEKGSIGNITLYAGWQHVLPEEWVIDKAASCTQKGLRHKVCSVCKNNVSYEILALVPHIRSEEVKENIVEPTCTQNGSYDSVFYCTVCGTELSRIEETVTALGHTKSAEIKENIVEPTCTRTGSYISVYTCTECGTELSRIEKITEKLPHTLNDDNVCEVCGQGASSGLKYSQNSDNTYTVTGIGSCTDTEIVIPKKYNGNLVTSIRYFAFENCSGLTSITIPNSVTTISDNAFINCSSLTSITIPNSVTTIGVSAFSGCSGLTSIMISNSVTTIGDSAFYGCSGLTSITIGSNVTTICYEAFYDCSGLTSITIPNSVTYIDDYAFKNCRKLTSITIPNRVTFGEFVFYECIGLKSVYISDLGKWCEASFGSNYSNPLYYAGNLYLNNKLVTNLVIPNTITTIGDYAFYGCRSLTSITIPNSVTTIGGFAFEDCSRLKGVNITDLEKWCEISFSNSTANPLYYAHNLYLNNQLVTNLVIPNTITTIGVSAFSGCSGLTSITIPNSVTTIDNSAFYKCSGLKMVFYSGSAEEWNKISIDFDNSCLTSAKRVYNSDGVEREYAFITNCEQTVDTITAKYLDRLPVIEREGHRFVGWYDNAEFSGNPVSVPYYSTDKTTLYAKWLAEDEWNVLHDGSSFERALIAESGKSYSVNIASGGQVVYFAFTATESKSYTIQSTGSSDTYATLYDASQSSLTTNDDGGSGSNFKITYTMTAGNTYYIAVKFYSSSSTGTFEVEFN